MQKNLALVMSGGGSKGALQVGALKALMEKGCQPDILVGTSVGAINASYLAINGFNQAGLEGLISAWNDPRVKDLLPANYLRLALHLLLNHPPRISYTRMREFFISYGVTPDLKFTSIQDLTLILVATDLNSTSPVLYGLDPEQAVLEGLLASTAIPPWVAPLHKEDQWLMDGGLVSNLSIESAVKVGATEIIALDLFDIRSLPDESVSVSQLLNRIITTVGQRQVGLELELAAAHGIPVHHLNLVGETPVTTWDFTHTSELIERGYQIARQEMDGWEEERESKWDRWFTSLKQSISERLQR